MGRRRLSLALALAGGVLLLAGAFYFSSGAELVVYDMKTDRVLFRSRVRSGERFSLSYLHSVSRSRVSGRFEVTPAYEIRVRETSFGSFGPGLPDLRPGDDYEVKDGIIKLRNLVQTFPRLSFFVHPGTEHRLEIGARRLELSAAVEPGSRITITVRPPLISSWLPASR